MNHRSEAYVFSDIKLIKVIIVAYEHFESAPLVADCMRRPNYKMAGNSSRKEYRYITLDILASSITRCAWSFRSQFAPYRSYFAPCKKLVKFVVKVFLELELD